MKANRKDAMAGPSSPVFDKNVRPCCCYRQQTGPFVPRQPARTGGNFRALKFAHPTRMSFDVDQSASRLARYHDDGDLTKENQTATSPKRTIRWPTLDDFRIRASNFALTNGSNILRIIAGAFMFPHVMGKFAAGTLNAATVGCFAKAGFDQVLWPGDGAGCAEE